MNKLLLVFIYLSISGIAQVSTLKIKKEKTSKAKPLARTDIHSIDVYYGNFIFKDNFYNELNSVNAIDISLPARFIGVGISGYERRIGPSYILFQIDAQKYLPQIITVNDSLKATFSGAKFGMGFGKRFRSNNGNLSLACYMGFNSGRLTLKNTENISIQKPFFCPKISVQPKVIIWHIALSITITAQGDITSSKWFPTYSGIKTKVDITNLNQTGISALLGVGYRF